MILRTPVPRAFPARSAAFTAWTSHGVLGSVRLDQGTECFTALENASADRSWTHAALPLESLASRDAGALERGFFLPTAPIAIEPLTPLSPLPTSAESSVNAFALPSQLFALASLFAVPREEAAKAAVTTFS